VTEFQREYAPLVRDLLIGCARRGETITYADTETVLGLAHHRPVSHLLRAVGQNCAANGEPILTALVVTAGGGDCGDGLRTEFGIEDAELERNRCQEWWQAHEEEPTENLRRRAVRFAAVATRPEQAAFRSAVYEAYGGKCALSGCAIASLLDAAHRPGRDWRGGDNRAEDGVLLRADLHRLLDAGLMTLEENGQVSIAEEATPDYGHHDGACWLPTTLN